MYVESFTILLHFNYLGVSFITRNEEYTKHYYIEGERVCSKIGGGFGVAPQSPTGSHLSFIAGDASSVRGNLKHLVFDDLLCVGYNNIWNMLSTLPPALNTANDPKNLRYFYHPDHPGSSSMISNISGRADQHIQYLPFGELFVSQRNSSFDSRYKFTAKELDNELRSNRRTPLKLIKDVRQTNYTYFGARYYDSDLSSWLSVDPMSDKYPNLSPYNYCAGNPVRYTDPDGKSIDDYFDINGVYLYSKNPKSHNIIIVDNTGKTSLLSSNKLSSESLRNIGLHYASKLENTPSLNIWGLGGYGSNMRVETYGDYANHLGIMITTGNSLTNRPGLTNELIDNYYNFMSALRHESWHYLNQYKKKDGVWVKIAPLDINIRELDAYNYELEGTPWQMTTTAYQINTIQSIGKYIYNINDINKRNDKLQHFENKLKIKYTNLSNDGSKVTWTLNFEQND